MARIPPHYKGSSVSHGWSVGAGAMRVECSLGHSESLGDAPTIEPCDVMIGGVELCGRDRVILAHGPYEYDPTNEDQVATMSALAPWGVP